MLTRLLLAVVFALSLLTPATIAPTTASADACQFVLGFKLIHDMIPAIVGDCTVDEHHNPNNGDGLQETTGPTGKGGLLVWRKTDNWTAYTDGYWTWVNGPNGLQKRLNTERFSWEKDPIVQPTPAPTPPPTPQYGWRAEMISWAPNCGTTWMWGNVYDRNGALLNGVSIKSWNDWGNEYIIGSGSDSTRGAGGWVRLVNNKDNPQTWYVAVVDGSGNLASQVAIVKFDGDCGNGAQEVRMNFHEN